MDDYIDTKSTQEVIAPAPVFPRPKTQEQVSQPTEDEFKALFQELADSRSSSGRLLYVFVKRNLVAFHLEGNYTVAFVLNESYLRAWKQILRGEPIRNLSAWTRKTSFNVIRELKRAQQRSVPFEEYEHVVEAEQSAQQEDLEDDLEDDLEMLRFAFQLLDPMDKKLLNLKIVQDLSWKEVREILRSEGDKDCSDAALRKRKERALIRLRKRYHALKPTDFKLSTELPWQG